MSGYFKQLADGSIQELNSAEAAPYISGAKRHKKMNDLKIVFTDAEEAARDAEEAAFVASAPARAATVTRLQTDEAERQAIKNNAAFMTFVNMTPAEVDTWVATNVNSLADAKLAIARLAKFVNIAVRRSLRNGG